MRAISRRGSWNGTNFPAGKLQDPLRNNFRNFNTISYLNPKIARNCRNFQDPPFRSNFVSRSNFERPTGIICRISSRFKSNCLANPKIAATSGHIQLPHPTHTCGDLSCGRDDLPLGNERLTNARIHTREHSSS